jgi:hypothetical protein
MKKGVLVQVLKRERKRKRAIEKKGNAEKGVE